MQKKKLILIISVSVLALALIVGGCVYFATRNVIDTNGGADNNTVTDVQDSKDSTEKSGESSLHGDVKNNESNTITELPSGDDLGDMIERFNELEDGSAEKEALRQQLEDILSYAEDQAANME